MKLNYFDIEEFNCNCGCGKNNISIEFVKLLDLARARAGVPFKINSGCRCSKHNTIIGGSSTSSHKLGLAADIRAEDSMTRFKIVEALLSVGIKRIGINKSNSFIHVDVDYDKPQGVMWIY